MTRNYLTLCSNIVDCVAMLRMGRVMEKAKENESELMEMMIEIVDEIEDGTMVEFALN